jgi:hypothetical protein
MAGRADERTRKSGAQLSKAERDHFKIFTVFENPSDYPGKFVIRESRITTAGALLAPMPLAICDTLEQARASIAEHHPGLIRMHRMPGDDPVIVEVWL